VLKLVPVPAPGGVSLLAAALGATLALAAYFVSLWAIATTVRRRVILDAALREGRASTRHHGATVRPQSQYLGIILIGSGSQWRSRTRFSCSRARRTSCRHVVLHPGEERMMSSEFGAQFEEYAHRVADYFLTWSVPSQMPHNKRMHMSARACGTPRSRSGAGAALVVRGWLSHRAAGGVWSVHGGAADARSIRRLVKHAEQLTRA